MTNTRDLCPNCGDVFACPIHDPFDDLEAEIDQDRVTPEAHAWHDALMFPAVDAVSAAIPAPYGAATGYRYSEWPSTAAFFAEHVAASAVRPEPTS